MSDAPKDRDALIEVALTNVLGEDAAKKAIAEFEGCAECQNIMRSFSRDLRTAMQSANPYRKEPSQ